MNNLVVTILGAYHGQNNKVINRIVQVAITLCQFTITIVPFEIWECDIRKDKWDLLSIFKIWIIVNKLPNKRSLNHFRGVTRKTCYTPSFKDQSFTVISAFTRVKV